MMIPPASNNTAMHPASKVLVPDVAPTGAKPFPRQIVRLLEGPFFRAMELDQRYLLSLDTDRLVHNFRVNAGLPSAALPLGGWEDPGCELRGHFVGHYLSACAMMYAGANDHPLKEKADDVVTILAQCQEKLGGGYLSAFPEEFIDRVESGQKVWAPYYTLHKICAGLLDMYVYCESALALEVCRRFADWAVRRNGRLTDEQMQRMLQTEYGGMNEVLADLYAITGEDAYLQLSKRFNDAAVIDPASRGEDTLTGLHANTQIPKFIGAARQYELTGDASLRQAARFFWDTVVHERSYVIGGNSDAEQFSPKEKLSEALGPETTETCNTYNMLKLTGHLFSWEPRAEYADYYERALINHILASQDPRSGMMCYYVPLRSGSRKDYNKPTGSFWCCTGTGVENHARYGDFIYFHDDANTLWVNLFIASELNWKQKGLRLVQETSFPETQETRLTVHCDGPLDLRVNVRRPFWAEAGFAVHVNGQKQDTVNAPGSYVTLARTWTDGDVVELTMPFALRTEGFKDNPARIALLQGPVVLCAETDPVSDPASPLLYNGRVPLEPFYKMHDGRHCQVYFDQAGPVPHECGAASLALIYEQEQTMKLLGIGPVVALASMLAPAQLCLCASASTTQPAPGIHAINPPEHGFYSKELDYDGIIIKASKEVSDEALVQGRQRLSMMLKNLPSIRKSLAAAGAELHIIGRNQVTSDLPENRSMKGKLVNATMTVDERTRGLGGLKTSCGEENLLRLEKDRYRGRDICVHEFAHNIYNHGMSPALHQKFKARHKQALAEGLWVGSYAGSNDDEFFAETTMWYFGTHGDLHMKGPKPDTGPAGLKAYDPKTYAMLDDFYKGKMEPAASDETSYHASGTSPR